MYTPKIYEPLIPVLYRLARQRHQPMTEVASSLILEALEHTELPQEDRDNLMTVRRSLTPLVQLKEAA
jgi:hypothetical protein